jgi:putative transposase
MADDKDMATLLEEVAGKVKGPEDLAAAVTELKQRAMNRILQEEMTEHLGYEKHAPDGYNGGNSRNGSTTKTVLTDTGAVELRVPRDREGSFEPQVVKKGQRRLQGFDEKVISLYARGLTVREVRGHLEEIYGVDVSPDLISRVTQGVLEEVAAWQQRPLEAVYPMAYFDGFVVKARHDGVVRNRTVYVVLGVNMQGHKEVLGLWVAEHEGAKFWLSVMNELRHRGVKDILIASVDGLKGFPDAIEAAFPQTTVQTCIVHMVRNSTRMVAYKNRRAVAKSLRSIYTAATEEAALAALDGFSAEWDDKYPSISRSWRDNWARISPFFEFSPEIRKAVYTTNPIEALNRQLRKVVKTRGAFPNDKAVFKLLWLAITRLSEKWTYPKQGWDLVVQQLKIHFGDRVPLEAYADR